MPGIIRKIVDSAGGTLITGSPDVFANGNSVVRKGDKLTSHGKGKHSSGPSMVSCASTVFCNGIAVCRKGDVASCGHTATGSSDVFVES